MTWIRPFASLAAIRLAVILAILVSIPATVRAHSLRVDQATLRETAPGLYDLSVQVPASLAWSIAPPVLPERCAAVGDPRGRQGLGSVGFEFRCATPLRAADSLVLPWGGEGVMLTVAWPNADSVTQLVMRQGEQIEIGLDRFRAGSGSLSQAARRYLALGVEHILMGADHLAFVLGLLLLVRGVIPLVKAITAFSVAHSLTLALATLGLVELPPAPVEAAIALSIAFLASEIVDGRQGKFSLSHRSPWLVAFGFGLLHGLGFAGALREMGLPTPEIPIALLFFNLGVEFGQLIFVAAILLLGAAARPAFSPYLARTPAWSGAVPAYSLGTIAMYWMIERSGAMLGLG